MTPLLRKSKRTPPRRKITTCGTDEETQKIDMPPFQGIENITIEARILFKGFDQTLLKRR